MRRLLKYILVILLISAGAGRLHAQYDKDAFFTRGRMALADGKYALAIENFNVLSQLDTSDYWTFFFKNGEDFWVVYIASWNLDPDEVESHVIDMAKTITFDAAE